MEINIESSYKENNLGKVIYNYVRLFKPKKLIDFGLLHGYSLVHMGLAIKDNNLDSTIIGYDLFEDYPYNHAIRSELEENLIKYNIDDIVTLKKLSFDDWLLTNEDFDFLHVDISNTALTIEKLYNKFKKRNKIILFEGGSRERDTIPWMLKYNCPKMTDSYVPYTCIDSRFPSISKLELYNEEN